MASEAPASAPTSTAVAEAPEGGDDAKKADCCAECKAGLAKDRTGQKADTIPCADFTADLNPWCLTYFRSHPIKASECK